MKVLFVVPELANRSVTRQISALAHGLKARGYATKTLAMRRNSQTSATSPDDEATTVLGRGWSCDPRPFYQLAAVVRSEAPDVIHFWHCGHSALSAYSLACRSTANRCVTPDAERLLQGRRHWFSASLWLVSSESQAAAWRQKGALTQRMSVIPPAMLVTSSLRRNASGSNSLRKELGLSKSARVILCAGHLTRAGGWLESIWAFNILHFLYPELHLCIAGDGPQLVQLQRFTRAIGMQQNVHLLGWRDDLADLIAMAEVVWCPSLVDAAPFFMMEALAAGKPVVATDQPSIREIVMHGETALVYPPGDQPALARQARTLLEQPALAQSLGSAAQQLIERKFGPDQWIERHLHSYRQAS